MQPLISVILPTYNGEDYIEMALTSLINQNVNLEIIVSDDCSKDKTVSIVKSIKSDRIKLFTNDKNGGLFVNLNRCIRNSQGKYIQIFSQDDVAYPGFLVAQLQALLDRPETGMVYSSCNIIDESGKIISLCDDDGTPRHIDFEMYLFISSRHGSLPASISNVMIKRATFDKVGLFDEKFKVAGDLEFYNRVAECFMISRNRTLLLEIRTHKGMLSRNSTTSLNYMIEELYILPFYKRHLDWIVYNKIMLFRARTRGADHAGHIVRLALRFKWKEFRLCYGALSQAHNVLLCVMFLMLRQGINLYSKVFTRLKRFIINI